MGKLSYLISLWGGTSKENLNALQVIQNKAARFVSRDWTNSTVQNLSSLGWLSVNQMIFYHTVLLMFKLKRSRAVGGRYVSRLGYVSSDCCGIALSDLLQVNCDILQFSGLGM